MTSHLCGRGPREIPAELDLNLSIERSPRRRCAIRNSMSFWRWWMRSVTGARASERSRRRTWCIDSGQLMANPNYLLLVEAARLLKPMLGELVFVGGCATGLLITDRAAADVRPTYDVDAIAEITSYMGYTEFSKRLKALGFREDTRE